MEEIISRIIEDMIARTTGEMWFRVILQPTVATIFGLRAGRVNAPTDRKAKLRRAVQDVGKMFAFGVALDVVFQLLVLKAIYPGEAILVAILLVALPYCLFRELSRGSKP
jgi:hypothetical protein